MHDRDMQAKDWFNLILILSAIAALWAGAGIYG